MYLTLNQPPDDKARSEREVSLVESYFKSRKVKMGAAKRRKFDAHIRRVVEDTWEKTASLRTNLKENNDIMEGEEDTVDFPFGPGQSSALDVRLAASRARTLRSNFIRTALSSHDLFVAEMMPGAKKDAEINTIEDAVNWLASDETNLLDALKSTPIPIFRDGLSLIYGDWEREIQRGRDYRSYAGADEFVADYPDEAAAGVSEDKFVEILEFLTQPDAEVHVEFEADFVSKNNANFKTFPLAKFLWAPLHISCLEDAELYGYWFTQSASQFRSLQNQGFYDSEPAEASKRKSDIGEWSTYDDSRDKIEGIDAQDDTGRKHTIAKITVAWDPGEDGVIERYQVYYEMDLKKCLRIEHYGRWRNIPNIIPFGFIERDNRLLGVSLLNDGKDLFREVNALHRHRSNVRRLTDSVTLIIPKSLKEDVDLGAEYAEFRPGMTIWVPDVLSPDKYPKQLQIFNTSRSNDSLDEESLVVRYIDSILGVTEGQSGRESSIDPSAPASKTRQLLQRADMRIEDLVEQWRRSIPKTVNLLQALYYENAPAKLKFLSRRGGKKQESDIATALLADPRRRFVLKAVRPESSPEFEMNKVAALVAMAFQMQYPVMSKPEIVMEAWNDYVISSRIDLPERFMIKLGNDGSFQMGGQQVQPQQLQQQLSQLVAAKQAENIQAKEAQRGSR